MHATTEVAVILARQHLGHQLFRRLLGQTDTQGPLALQQALLHLVTGHFLDREGDLGETAVKACEHAIKETAFNAGDEQERDMSGNLRMTIAHLRGETRHIGVDLHRLAIDHLPRPGHAKTVTVPFNQTLPQALFQALE